MYGNVRLALPAYELIQVKFTSRDTSTFESTRSTYYEKFERKHDARINLQQRTVEASYPLVDINICDTA